MTIVLPGAPPESGPPMDRAPVVFRGDGGDFVMLCIRGALLELVTFGFYRFWLATDMRRRLWTATSLAGEALEYTGRGRDLLIGFLFALAIIAPVNIVYFLVGIEAERMRAFASFPLALFYMMFGQFALYRARRYRLTRTIWRGARLWMDGSGVNYALRWLGWAIVALLTLGLAYPWMRASLERYKMSHTYYGDLRGRFEGRGWSLFRRGFGFWICGIVVVALLGSGAYLQAPAMRASHGDAGMVLMGVGTLGAFLLPFLWPFFRALEWRWWADGARFGDMSMQSNVRGGAMLALYLKCALVSVLVVFGMLFAIMLTIALGVLVVSLVAGSSVWPGSGAELGALIKPRMFLVGVLTLLGYLALLLAMGVVARYYLTFRIWGLVAGSLTISKLSALDGVVSRGEAANAIGEGLADSLDVAGF